MGSTPLAPALVEILYCLHLFRVSVGEVLQVYVTPDVDFPIAPAGLQNAPGETVGTVAVGVGVAVAVGIGDGVAVGVGVAVAVGVGDGVAVGVGVGVAVAVGVGDGVTVGVGEGSGVDAGSGVGTGADVIN